MNSLQRFNSEQNLAKMDGSSTSRSVRPIAKRTSFDKPPIHTKLRTSRSQPVITNTVPDPAHTKLKSPVLQNGFGETEYDSDNERDARIMKWLIGVDQSAEIPPTPDFSEEEPAQTDTAIHIVYQS